MHSSITDFAASILGPVLHHYFTRLNADMRYMDDGNTQFLFAARAGIRIRKLFEIYLQRHSLPAHNNADDFWVSRLLVCKGTALRAPEQFISVVSHEFLYQTLEYAIKSLVKHDAATLKQFDFEDPIFQQPAAHIADFLQDPLRRHQPLLSYLDNQGTLFSEYLSTVLNGKSHGVIIDSGWQGTTQMLLHRAYPGMQWSGLYVGRILSTMFEPDIVPNVVGILFESETYDPKKPETSLVLHRHIIESLFETKGTSIEWLARDANRNVYAPAAQNNLDEQISPEDDPYYVGVRDYLQTVPENITLVESYQRYQDAIEKLSKLLTTPSLDDVNLITIKDRSADFGRETMVKVILPPVDRDEFDSPERRIRDSLWQQGQMAVEYSPKIALTQQLNSLMLTDDYFFDPREGARTVVDARVEVKSPATVAVITRTKNRPVLFKRAAESVANQTYPHVQWVVVNDGGDFTVQEIIEHSAIDKTRVSAVSNMMSVGMEAASNLGIRHSESDYLVIHDDDDSWDPTFLEKTVTFLESDQGKKYAGVITGTTYVSEEILGDKVLIHGRYPYNDWIENVHVSEMVKGNIFAPIAFVYRRALYDKIGGYDESLPVLGDWDFNLRFLMEADIGVIREPLANYHHRDRDTTGSGVYSNSVAGGKNKHVEYNAILRNHYLRTLDPTSNPLGLLVSNGFFAEQIVFRLGDIVRQELNNERSVHQLQQEISGLKAEIEQLARERDHFAELADNRWIYLQLALLGDKRRRLF